ncbi:MAG: DUF3299 domain-containing protein [Caldimonas sp.]|jgi:hypothetical protein|uniref:DUF3299 domain-containing protein n=1 Tax=Caldimonas sp. TaxID=2838790 RepID=UPI00391D4A30
MTDRRRFVCSLAALAAPGAWAQLAAPLGGAAPAPPLGSGPGYHSPDSPIPPLQEREGVLSWKLLGSVKTRAERQRLRPIFPADVRALDRQIVKVQGFMMPLDASERQHHFLLSAVPTTCSFCIPAGPEGLVEVRAKTPVRYSVDPVVVEGRLSVLDNDPYGLFYRLTEAQPAR